MICHLQMRMSQSHGAGQSGEIFDAVEQDCKEVLQFAKGYQSHGAGQLGRTFDDMLDEIAGRIFDGTLAK